MQDYILTMLDKAVSVMQHAYVPLCQFPVGACISSSSGELFVGCNWENSATPMGQCAEVSAISAMLSQGQRKISAMVLVAAKMPLITPCGACRQRLNEFAEENMQIYCFDVDRKCQAQYSLAELLPMSFNINLEKINHSPSQ